MLGRFLLDIIKRGPAGALTPQGMAPPNAATSDVIPIDDTLRLVRARHGWFLANRHDLYLGRALIRYGECSQIEHEFLVSLLRPGDNLVEVGANIGVHTIGMAKSVGPAGVVVAIEPQPAIFRALCANLALNNLLNVIVHSCGCGASKDTMVAPAIDYSAAVDHNSGGVSLTSTGVGIPIAIEPLDDLLEGIPCLRIIKIDVEGMEQQVLQGATRLIAKHRPLLYVENDRIEKSKSLIEWIMTAGYRLWWHTPPLFNPDNLFCLDENDYPNIGSFNMVCCPGEAEPIDAVLGLTEITDADRHLLKR